MMAYQWAWETSDWEAEWRTSSLLYMVTWTNMTNLKCFWGVYQLNLTAQGETSDNFCLTHIQTSVSATFIKFCTAAGKVPVERSNKIITKQFNKKKMTGSSIHCLVRLGLKYIWGRLLIYSSVLGCWQLSVKFRLQTSSYYILFGLFGFEIEGCLPFKLCFVFMFLKRTASICREHFVEIKCFGH